jgi:hypothetical protein
MAAAAVGGAAAGGSSGSSNDAPFDCWCSMLQMCENNNLLGESLFHAFEHCTKTSHDLLCNADLLTPASDFPRHSLSFPKLPTKLTSSMYNMPAPSTYNLC